MKIAWHDIGGLPPGGLCATVGGLQARIWEAAGAWQWQITGHTQSKLPGAGKVALWDSMPEAPLKQHGPKDGLIPAQGAEATREAAIAACEHAMDTAAVVSARGIDF